MEKLDNEQKMALQNLAISSLTDEFVALHEGRFPELGDLSDFAHSIFVRSKLLPILRRRNPILGISIQREVMKYPNFFLDLLVNLEFERVNRSQRPERKVS